MSYPERQIDVVDSESVNSPVDLISSFLMSISKLEYSTLNFSLQSSLMFERYIMFVEYRTFSVSSSSVEDREHY